ncbi:hypothetical protein GCM10011609_65560 [Lentzea pudingi]|uniref:MFS transporter n=1 Tax=Lentzea pudingi TaxID=1789439 RepID=A0ABQ2IP12_9PSEU|nr:MFS transporter [Lentzea pudingi]GGN15810.1 hypothetical protein GCM10011609_65560 [Lentzea pudingi]
MTSRHRLIWAAFISQAGNWLTFTGLLQYVQSQFGSLSTAGMLFAQSLPAVVAVRGLAQRIAPEHAHRAWLVAQIGLAVCTVTLVGLASSLWFIYAYFAVTTVLKAVSNTLFMTFVGEWVPAEQKASTYTAIGTAGSITLTVSPAVGGVMASTVGYWWLFIADATSFLLAALVLARSGGAITAADGWSHGERVSPWRTWVGKPEGFGAHLARPALAWTSFAVVGAGVNAVEMPVFDDIHAFQADQFGFALACYGAGGLLAFGISLLAPQFHVPVVALSVAYGGALIAWVCGGTAGAYAGFAVAGLTYGLINGRLRSSLDRAAEADGVDPIPLWAWATQVTFLVSVAVLGAAAAAFALRIPAAHVAAVVLVLGALVPFTMTRLTTDLTRTGS